ncbi:unnamed protein product [Cylindrotheca closterium]|uniref:SAP domain-containing protein n=1 Tax=Cylindrotheca closterium TaxID=2856 RepID=A0AAD2CZQ2_9STRA|nr:unnamed protein product [Cylindrotheca closterium]
MSQAFIIAPHPSRLFAQYSRYVPLPQQATLQQQQQQQQPQNNRIRSTIRRQVLNDDFFDDIALSRKEIESLTIPGLKQQLRLRGLKVSGKKQDLVDRLLKCTGVVREGVGLKAEPSVPQAEDGDEEELITPDVMPSDAKATQKTKAQKFAEETGKEFIDVTAYLDDDEMGQNVKSSIPLQKEEEPEGNPESSNPEVWGTDAKIVEDFEGSSPIVDALSRTIIEYRGSNQTFVQAYVVASRDALKPFLAGANRTTNPEEALKEIQMRREQASRRPIKVDDQEGLDEGDEFGIFDNILHRDFSDWGEYTLTGAQLSAQEVQGVLLLSDVYGAYTDDTKMLAEKIAFECQPVVVLVPDLFRGKPWKEDPNTPGFNEKGQDYEEWRAQHSDIRVNVDIRAAAAVLREQYGVSSVAVWGTCYGGGRALEAAAGYLPDGQIHDVNGAIGPVLVKPDVVVSWYPTRYNAKALFGPDRANLGEVPTDDDKAQRKMAVMGVFAGNDELSGATAEDAAELKSLLESDERVKDLMVKVFPNQDHGFAHIGLSESSSDESSEFERFVDNEFGGSGRVGMDDGDAEVACLLSTAFMETYSRVFLPTTGPPISSDDLASGWSADLDIPEFQSRDIRQEIEDSLDNFVEEPLGGKRFDPNNDDQRDELADMLRNMEDPNVPVEYKIEDGDTIEIMYAKLKAYDSKFQIF